jgi:predicted metalloprotease with PDZ domain
MNKLRLFLAAAACLAATAPALRAQGPAGTWQAEFDDRVREDDSGNRTVEKGYARLVITTRSDSVEVRWEPRGSGGAVAAAHRILRGTITGDRIRFTSQTQMQRTINGVQTALPVTTVYDLVARGDSLVGTITTTTDRGPLPPRRITAVREAMAPQATPATTAAPSRTTNIAPQDSAMDVVVTPHMVGDSLAGLRVHVSFVGDADGSTTIEIPVRSARGRDRLQTISDLRILNATSSNDSSQRTLTHVPGARISVSYLVTQKFHGVPMESVIERDFFSVISDGLFFYIEGPDRTVNFRWGPFPVGWTVASDLEHAAFENRPLKWLEYGISTMIGGRDVMVQERRTGTGRFRIAMRRGGPIEPERLMTIAGRIALVAHELWQDPGANYFISLTTVPGFNGQAGTGRGDGFALYLPTTGIDTLELFNTVAHEHLHTWIASRLAQGPMWFREGVTEYYARMVNLRAGTYPAHAFADRWNSALMRYAQSAHRLKPDSVTDPLFHRDADAERLGEDRGSMMAALLDYHLRQQTEGRVDMRAVLLEVKREVEAKSGSGSGPQRLVRIARERHGVELQPLLDRHLGRGEDIAFPADAFGRCFAVTTTEVPRFTRGLTGAVVGSAVTGVAPDGPAYAAGLRDGMILLARTGGKIGDPRHELVYRVRDGEQERTIRYMPAGREKVRVQELRLKPGLSPAAVASCTTGITGMAQAERVSASVHGTRDVPRRSATWSRRGHDARHT